jgi:solute carrier family 25 carnitine/acylcarnitine transporter 20/29
VFCKLIPNHDPNTTTLGLLLAGGFAGIVGWMTTYPVDMIKTRLQSSTGTIKIVEEDRNPRYKNLLNAYRVILKEEGYRVFFSGMSAACVRAFPTNAVIFYIVAITRTFLEEQIET